MFESWDREDRLKGERWKQRHRVRKWLASAWVQLQVRLQSPYSLLSVSSGSVRPPLVCLQSELLGITLKLYPEKNCALLHSIFIFLLFFKEQFLKALVLEREGGVCYGLSKLEWASEKVVMKEPWVFLYFLFHFLFFKPTVSMLDLFVVFFPDVVRLRDSTSFPCSPTAWLLPGRSFT